MYYNKCTFVGRLTRDPELRFTKSGIAVANFNLAVDRPFLNARKERETDFIPVTVWRKLAETCANNLAKGRLVLVEGRLQMDSYTDKEGVKRRTSNINADTVRFLDWGKDKKKTEDTPEPPAPDVPEVPDTGIPEDIVPEIDWPEDPPF
jgi:single-strand DNA-binding protein